MCVFGARPVQMLDRPGPEGWRPGRAIPLDDIGFGIIAWRTWRWRSAPYLEGSFSKRWRPGKVMDLLPGYGIQRPGGGRRLKPEGQEGVYAWKREEAVCVRPIPLAWIVWGEVLLWGSIAEYKDGYRAQYAYPLSLFVGTKDVAESVTPWAKRGVYINVYSPMTPGADKYGYIEYA